MVKARVHEDVPPLEGSRMLRTVVWNKEVGFAVVGAATLILTLRNFLILEAIADATTHQAAASGVAKPF